MTSTRAADIRAGLDHPIIDGDGHFVEIGPLLNDEVASYIEQDGGAELRERYLQTAARPFDTSTNLSRRDRSEIRENWTAMPSWWGWQCRNTLDRATMHLPELLHERLDEIGLDFALLYPSMSLSFLDMSDAELGAAMCRAVNRMHARMFASYGERMTVGALIPMATPDTAIAELEYAVDELGLKTAVISGAAHRPIPRVHNTDAGLDRYSYRLDTFGLDSDFDYDPFWAACQRLGISPVTHSSLQAHRTTRSVSSYVYNHIGGLAAMHESLCKSLFLGGVTNRFPELRIGFLEGGVAWAVSLYADLIGHWEKRNADEIGQLDPDTLDVDGLMAFVDRYADEATAALSDDIREYFSRPAARPERLDEFEAVGITDATDLRDKFVPNFFFGCEADDPLVAWAFNTDVNPMGAQLQPLFGSDISHWDVPDMTEPLVEAFELVEHGLITEAQFADFTYGNAVKLHASANPTFFEGTAIEATVHNTLAADDAAT